MSHILGVHSGKILAQWNKTATNDMRHSMNSFGEKASRMKPEITAVSCGPTHLQETIRTQARIHIEIFRLNLLQLSKTTVMDTIAWHSAVRYYSTNATVDYELLYFIERDEHRETLKKIGTLEAQLEKARFLRWLNLSRDRIDDLETDYGLGVTLDWKTINLLKSNVQKSAEIRKQRWRFILTNSEEDAEIDSILTAIQNNDPPITTEEFVCGVAKAYDLLSQRIKNESLDVGMERKEMYHLTQSFRANYSLTILINDLDFDVGNV